MRRRRCARPGTTPRPAGSCGRAGCSPARCSASRCCSGATTTARSSRCATSARIAACRSRPASSTAARSNAATTAGALPPTGVAPRSRRWSRARHSISRRSRVPRYPAREVQGNVWVYFGDDPEPRAGDPAHRRVLPNRRRRGSSRRCGLRAAIDHAVVGLMDPAHGPFVHRAWWWRSRRSMHEKAKAFEPSPWGFTMSRHTPSSNSRAYRLLGGAPETEIAFRLPSVRIEQIRAGRYAVTNLTALTPIDDETTEVNHCVYWNMRRGSVRAEAAAAALCARLSAAGPRHHGAAAAGAALRPGAVADRRRRHTGALVLPAEAGIPPRRAPRRGRSTTR